MLILNGKENIAAMTTNRLIGLFGILVFGLLPSCRDRGSLVSVDVIVAPNEINYGDSFNILLVTSGEAGATTKIRVEKIERIARISFIGEVQSEKGRVVCYKVQPRKQGDLIIDQSMISGSPSMQIEFRSKLVKVKSEPECKMGSGLSNSHERSPRPHPSPRPAR